MSVVAMDMNTTTANRESFSMPTLRPMLATMMPTSPGGSSRSPRWSPIGDPAILPQAAGRELGQHGHDGDDNGEQ